MLFVLYPIGSVFGTLLAFCAMLAFVALVFKGSIKLISAIYRRYKYVKSDEFNAYLDSIPYETKLNDLYEKACTLMFALAILFIAVLCFNAPAFVVLLVTLPLIWSVRYSYKIGKALKKF